MTGPASHHAPGGDVPGGDEPTTVYEIRLPGTFGAGLRRQFPAASVVTTQTETVLSLPVERPAELDDLVAHLLSLGLVPTRVRRQVEQPDDRVSRDPARDRAGPHPPVGSPRACAGPPGRGS